MGATSGPMGAWGRAQRCVLALLLVFAALMPARARAGQPVIGPEREGEIAALFAPHALGSELAPGWTLHSFEIDKGTIRVWIAGPEVGAEACEGQARSCGYAQLGLDHPDYAPEGARELPGFGLSLAQAPPGSEAAIEALASRVAANDDGQFWRIESGLATQAEGAGSSALAMALSWASDGLILHAGLLVLLLALAGHCLRGASRGELGALAGILALGAALRLSLPVATTFAPWSYTRFSLAAKAIYAGPLLARLHPEPVWASELILASTLALALMAPLAAYVHARYLLEDRRAALLAALLLAILPLHLRFSHSDVAFIPSITVSSITFACVHAAIRERSGPWRWLSLAALPGLVALTYLVRPLNLMYFPLLLATALVNEGVWTDKQAPSRGRVVLVGVVLALLTFGVGVPTLLADYGEQVRGNLSLNTLVGAAEVMFSLRFNALLNPRMMPSLLTVLALLGAFDLWRRGRRRLAGFLGVWLLGFLVAHGCIVPLEPMMQARYHLHLIVPFVLLAVCGIEACISWLGERERGPAALEPALARLRPHARVLAGLLGAYLLAAPFLHLDMIREVEFNDQREWSFVHAQREVIPKGCTVLEYTAVHADARFARVGAHVVEQLPRSLWRVVGSEQREPGGSGHALSDEAVELLLEPPKCLYYYQGLPCYVRPPGAEIAPACDEVPGFVELREVDAVAFPSRIYDDNLGGAIAGQELEIRLVLYEVSGRR